MPGVNELDSGQERHGKNDEQLNDMIEKGQDKSPNTNGVGKQLNTDDAKVIVNCHVSFVLRFALQN